MVTGGRVYFLSRPRRFGKSLLISTLDALFKGQKELFHDTWIAGTAYDWAAHPVIRIDMTDTKRNTIELFNESLRDRLADIAQDHDVAMPDVTDASRALSKLIRALHAKHGKVVVLIDEHDEPILDNILKPAPAGEMREYLRDFYSILKAQDENLRFVMLTGITKLSKVSVFSGLNNLKDISMSNNYATICGYTHQELANTFAPWIQLLAKEKHATVESQFKTIREWSNGYQFTKTGERVYNPFSTLRLFDELDFATYWYSTGTPTFLVDLIEEHRFSPKDIERLEVTALALENHDLNRLGLVALLYQAGYLTIAKYDPEFDSFKLAYPNLEVKKSLTAILLSRVAETPLEEQDTVIKTMARAIRAGAYNDSFELLKRFLAAIPYEMHQANEQYYHSLFFLIFSLLGYEVNVEVSTNVGRIDAIMVFDDRVLIFVFKLDKTAEAALAQIHDKQYYQPYRGQGKDILLFGVNFSTAEKNITDWQQETLSE